MVIRESTQKKKKKKKKKMYHKHTHKAVTELVKAKIYSFVKGNQSIDVYMYTM